MKTLLLLLLYIVLSCSLQARIGRTFAECEQQYGAPFKKTETDWVFQVPSDFGEMYILCSSHQGMNPEHLVNQCCYIKVNQKPFTFFEKKFIRDQYKQVGVWRKMNIIHKGATDIYVLPFKKGTSLLSLYNVQHNAVVIQFKEAQ